MPTPPLSDDHKRETITAWREAGNSVQGGAALLGMNYNTFNARLRAAKAAGLHLSAGARNVVQIGKLGFNEAKGGWLHSYDDEGKKVAATRWAADDSDIADDVLDRIAARMERIIAAPSIIRPKAARADILNFIPVFDVHLGQRIGSFGTAQAVTRLQEGFGDVIERAPPAETTIILNGGDFTEANDNSALTPQSKHPLAVDMDFDDLADVAVDASIHLIETALRRSDRVIYQPLKGNHDPAMAVALRAGLRQRYRGNKRFHMKEGHELFSHEWEGNLIAGIHGDQKTTKPEMLALSIATRHAAAWGAAKRRELWRGHLHREFTASVPGMRVMQVNPICPPGRYANTNLFTGESDIQAVTYRRGGGRCATTVHIFDEVEP